MKRKTNAPDAVGPERDNDIDSPSTRSEMKPVEIPRFLAQYTSQQCDSRATLIACGWDDSELEDLLGDPDASKAQGGDAFGADRAFLAAIGLVDPDEDSPRGTRVSLWLGGMDDAESETDWPVALPMKMEGFPWLALCREDVAEAGSDLMLMKRSGPQPARVKHVHGVWNGFALVKVSQLRETKTPLSRSAPTSVVRG